MRSVIYHVYIHIKIVETKKLSFYHKHNIISVLNNNYFMYTYCKSNFYYKIILPQIIGAVYCLSINVQSETFY